MNPLIQYATTSDGVRIAYYSMGEGVPFVSTSELQWSSATRWGSRSATGATTAED